MSKREDAVKVLPEVLAMIMRELKKTDQYLEQSIAVAIVAENTGTALGLGSIKAQVSYAIDNLKEEMEEI